MRKPSLLVICLVLVSLAGSSQKPWELGGEYQRLIGKGYGGTMAGARYETYPGKSSWSFGVTYNFTPAKSYSVHKGFSVYAGYRYGFAYSGSGKGNAFGGARIYFLFENYEGKERANGLSILPVAELGYHLMIKNHIYLAPAVAGGYCLKRSKINNSLQEDEGGRILGGLSAGYRF
jgi:hypothetical protein